MRSGYWVNTTIRPVDGEGTSKILVAIVDGIIKELRYSAQEVSFCRLGRLTPQMASGRCVIQNTDGPLRATVDSKSGRCDKQAFMRATPTLQAEILRSPLARIKSQVADTLF